MRILWITNITLPPICEELNLPVPVTGGWMYSSLKELKKEKELEFAVATVYRGREFVKKEIGGTIYYLLPLRWKSKLEYQPSLETYWKRVREEFLPDVVHVHGTEFAHGLAYIRACGTKGVVVSIQGLVSVIARYYLAGISRKEVLSNLTFRDIVKGDNLLQQQRKFYKRGIIEQEYIRSVDHVMGRTSWDKAHVWAINPDVHYHFCNETLREEFYKHSWRYEDCEKHSIFVSQAGYPIKGLHQVLKAMPIVVKRYPDTKLYIAGNSIITYGWRRLTGYGLYIRRLIKKYHLESVVVFTGKLTEKEMCARYLMSNLFVCPSSIENSPNSLGEAQLLGVPCIASYVGGVPDMMKGYEESMYRFEEVEMLARKICNLFGLEEKLQVSKREGVMERHYSDGNKQRLLDVYRMISGTFKEKRNLR